MNIQGIVVSSTANKILTSQAGSSYEGWELIYKDLNSDEVKTLARPSQTLTQVPGLRDALTALTPGDKFVATLEKDGKWFKVTGINKGELATPLPSYEKKSWGGSRGTSQQRDYETKEERALRQKLIVRQSSVATALSAYAGGKTALDEEKVFALADKIEEWVWKGLN